MSYVKYTAKGSRSINYRWQCSKCSDVNTRCYTFSAKSSNMTVGRKVYQNAFDELDLEIDWQLERKVSGMGFGSSYLKTGILYGQCSKCKNIEAWASEYEYNRILRICASFLAVIGLLLSCYILYYYSFYIGILIAALFSMPFFLFLYKRKKQAKYLTSIMPIESIPILVYNFGDGQLRTKEEYIEVREEAYEKVRLERIEQLEREEKRREILKKVEANPELVKSPIVPFLSACEKYDRFSEVYSIWQKMELDNNPMYDDITNEIISKCNIERLYGADRKSTQNFISDLSRKLSSVDNYPLADYVIETDNALIAREDENNPTAERNECEEESSDDTAINHAEELIDSLEPDKSEYFISTENDEGIEVNDSEFRFCRKCGFELLSNSLFCSKCGTPITTHKPKCPLCGKQLAEESVFCHFCGAKVL